MIIRLLDSISEWSGKVASWLVLPLVAITTYDVAARYIFKAGSVALQELEWHIFSVLFLLAAEYTLKYEAHVRVTFFTPNLGPEARRL